MCRKRSACESLDHHKDTRVQKLKQRLSGDAVTDDLSETVLRFIRVQVDEVQSLKSPRTKALGERQHQR